ncbi:MAG: acyltransferase family protein [Gemmatimonadaceae bacterium]
MRERGWRSARTENFTNSSTPAGRARYRPDIDGLRAIAVTAVVAFHAGVPGTGGGFVGVDVFFVISGFLITRLLVDDVAANGRVMFAEFYARRARRLLPALTVMLIAVLLLGRVFLSVLGEQQTFAKSAIATVLFSSNFYFMVSTGGYFEPAAVTQPLLHTWSLGVEEQFYVVWPLMVHFVGLRVKSSLSDFESRLRMVLAVVFAASLAWAIVGTVRQPAVAFYMMPPRAWEFAAGGLVALASRRLAGLSSTTSAVFGTLGVAAIVASVVILSERTPFPGVAALLPVAGAAAVIAAGVSRHKTSVMSVLSSRLMVYVGLVSYPWYLWHWPFLVIARESSLGRHSLLRDVGLVLVSLLLAIVTRDVIERRFRRPRGRGQPRPMRTFGVAVAASVVTLAVAVGLGLTARRDTRKPEFAALAVAKADRPASRATCDIRSSPDLQPAAQCMTGDTTSRRQIVLWGDSHAEHWMPLVSREGAMLSVGVLERSRSACPPLLGVAPVSVRVSGGDPQGVRSARACEGFNEAVVDEFRRNDQPRSTVGVIVAARWPAYLGKDSPFDDNAVFDLGSTDGGRPPSVEPSLLRLTSGLDATLAALADAGLRVVVLAPTPFLPFSGPDCLATRSATDCRVSRQAIERLRAPALEAVRGVVARFANARLWDPIDGLCGPEYCAATNGGVVVYRDLGHLTSGAVESLAARGRPVFEWLVGDSTVDRRF